MENNQDCEHLRHLNLEGDKQDNQPTKPQILTRLEIQEIISARYEYTITGWLEDEALEAQRDDTFRETLKMVEKLIGEDIGEVYVKKARLLYKIRQALNQLAGGK